VPDPGGSLLFTAICTGVYVDLTVQITGYESGDRITVSRYDVFGQLQPVRQSEDMEVFGGLFQAFDWEAPQGRPIAYRAEVTDGTDTLTAEVIADGVIDYGGDWIMPVGRTELGMNVTVEFGGVGGLNRDVSRSVLSVVNRPSPVVVSWGRNAWTTTISLLTLEDWERIQLTRLLNFPIIMFAARPGFGVDEPVFLSVGAVTEERTSGLGYETSRRWVADVQQVSRPPAFYPEPAPSFTWGDRLDDYTDWGQLLIDSITWTRFGGYS
jgi:hypothetical protein